jgi:hypothetical protein
LEANGCYFITLAVMVRETGFTINGPYFTDAYDGDWEYPDSCFYTPERGPTIGDDPAYWAVLRNGDGVPPEEWIDVWLDGIRIIHNGQAVDFEGCSDIFLDDYDQVSGIYKVYFNHSPFQCVHSPWHCAMQAGPHTIQFRVYDGVGHSVETPVTPFYVDVTGPDVYTWGRYICHSTEMIATITDPEACILLDSVWVEIWNILAPDTLDPYPILRYHSDVMTFAQVENGYQASFILTADDLDQVLLYYGSNINELAVTWHAENTLTLENQENTFLYIVDIQPPTVVPVSPVGAALDNDGDGVANEDPRDCINNDNDTWWDPYYEDYVERFDEDWIDFVPDTLLFGERPTIQGAVNDEPICGSGASGVNLDFFHLFIDGVEFTKEDASPENPYNFTIIQEGTDDAFFIFGGTDNAALDPFYTPGEHRVSVVAGDSVCGNIAPYPFSWTYYVKVPGPAITFYPVGEGCGNWFDPEITNEFRFHVQATAGCQLAINGIDYSVYVLPSNTLISGPTVIDPAGQDSITVPFTLSYPFQASDEGIRVHVTARNYLADGTTIGYTESDYTYAIDNAGPVISVTSPDDGEHFAWNSSVVAEATFDDAGRSGVKQTLTNFTVYGPDGSEIAGMEDLAENDAVHVKWVSSLLTMPGTYTVNLTVGDCVGNLSVKSWTFVIEPTGPAVYFAPAGECGNWFNPEGTNEFAFWVKKTGESPIAPNGIEYSVYVLPSGALISGPTVIDPAGLDSVHVNVVLGYTFTDADIAISLHVRTWSVNYNQETGEGLTVTAHTYAIDKTAPAIAIVSPESGSHFEWNSSVVVEATFNDASQSGVDIASIDFKIIDPRGVPLSGEGDGQAEIAIDHVKWSLTPRTLPGTYTVNLTVGDCVDNLRTISWTFIIESTGPSITFGPPEACGDWFNPEGSNEFAFWVMKTGDSPIAPNGIEYSIFVLPSGELISGPTLIDPAGQDSFYVNVVLGYVFSQTDIGIDLAVRAWSVGYNSETGEGLAESRHTYAIDRAGPVVAVVSPEDGEHYAWNNSVVVEASFEDAAQSGVESAQLAVWGPDGNSIELGEYEQDAAHVKWVSARLTIPGTYTVNLTVTDCVDNIRITSWTFFVESTAPAISFGPAEEGECGDWFDPEGANNFGFIVRATSEHCPIAPNGISYRVLVLPDSGVIIGWTVIHPENPLESPVHVSVSYPFQDSDLGIWIEAVARCEVNGDGYGVTTSNRTYAIDDLPPAITPVSPDSGQVFNRDQAIVIEATYTDDGGVVLMTNPGGGATMAIPVRAIRSAGASDGITTWTATDGQGASAALGVGRPGNPRAAGSANGGGHLDDVGSGIDSAKIRIISPNGTAIVPRPEDPNLEVYDDHIKYTLLPNHDPGWYTINITVWDCIGNNNTVSWPFFVTPDAPAVTFLPTEGECEYDGFWNPDRLLTLKATIAEVQGVNVNRSGISLNIYRIYNADGGVVEELLVEGAAYTLTPEPSDENTAQQFTLTATPSLDPAMADIAVRFELVVADVYGTTARPSKTYQIDRLAPWIEVLSPTALVAEGTSTTISAAYGDEAPPTVAGVPGGEGGKGSTVSRTLTGAPQQSASLGSRITRAQRSGQTTDAGKFGAWTSVITGTADDFDGNSGIDVSTVRLWLRGPDGQVYHLEDSTGVVDPMGVSWTGLLPRGEYTVTLWVADFVCNEATAIWSFRVANGVCPTIAFNEPYYVSSMPHTFTMHVTDQTGVDPNSLVLRVEKHQRVTTDSSQFEHYILLTDGAPIVWDAEAGTVTYVANFFLENTNGIKDIGVRLTLCAADLDANLCCSTQNYTVDIDRPIIDGVVPSPEIPLTINSRPTFTVNFHEEAGTGLYSDGVTISLATLNGVVIEGTDTVYVSGTGSVGWVTFQPAKGLEMGQYILRASVADVGGNVAMSEWVYRAGTPTPVLTGRKSYTWPNPFVPGEGAHFELGVAGDGSAFVMVKIYDFAGQYVATVYEGQYQPGQAVVWNGVNASGQVVANGVYLAHITIEAGGKVSDEILKVAFKKVK